MLPLSDPDMIYKIHELTTLNPDIVCILIGKRAQVYAPRFEGYDLRIDPPYFEKEDAVDWSL